MHVSLHLEAPIVHDVVQLALYPPEPYWNIYSFYVCFRSYYVDKWMKTPPKASQPPKDNQKCTSAPHNPVRARANQMESKEEDYISVYKRKQFQDHTSQEI